MRAVLKSAVAFVVAALLTGCIPAERKADITIVNGAEPESLDPAIVSGVPEMRITKALFEGVTRLDGRTGLPVPGLAERWEISPDALVYKFFLRTNAVWSTGEPITAEDVVWSWLRALDPSTGSGYAGQVFCIRGVAEFASGRIEDPGTVGIRALDERTVQVELEYPAPFFLDLCALPMMAVVPRDVIEQLGDRWLQARPLPTSGAFTLGRWRLNDRVRLLRNPLYWDAANTRSEVIDVLPTGSPSTALNLYESGVVDVVWDKDLVPSELLDVLAKRPDFHTFEFLGTYFVRFNVTRGPLQDAKVRRAFSLATDRARIVNKLFTSGEKPAFHFVPPATAHYKAPEPVAFDPDLARTLLAEAGYPGGEGFPPITYAYPAAAGGASGMQGKIAVELQQMWRKELGVTVALRQIERKVFYSAQARLDYDMSGSSWIADYNDPNTFLDLFMSKSGNNRTGWSHARYDELIAEANRQTDMERRAETFREAETLLIATEAPILPLYFFAGFNYFDPEKVEGIYQNALDEHPLQWIGRRVRMESRLQPE